MPQGNLRERYRIEVRRAVAGAAFTGDVEFANGYNPDDADGGPTVDRYKSLTAARNEASKWVNTFQSSGIDVEARVFGRVFGAAATDPERPMAPDEVTALMTNEVVYSVIDTPGRGRRQIIRLANKERAAAGDYDIDPNIVPDLV